MYAADNGNTDVVKFLLENKADINAMDDYGKILKMPRLLVIYCHASGCKGDANFRS